MIAVPKALQPWPPRERIERRRTVIGLGDLSASISPNIGGRSMSPAQMASLQVRANLLKPGGTLDVIAKIGFIQNACRIPINIGRRPMLPTQTASRQLGGL
jgi:hypothetical protein